MKPPLDGGHVMTETNQATMESDQPLAAGQEIRPEWLPDHEWPFSITSVTSGNHTLAVTDTGSTGPTLLFSHVGMWSILWRDLLVELAKSGYRCVTFDAPGSGLTAGPSKVDLNAAADAIDSVVQRLGLDDFTLVIHDLGGPAALEAASRWPDRVNGIAAINAFAWRPSGLSFRAGSRRDGERGNARNRHMDRVAAQVRVHPFRCRPAMVAKHPQSLP